MVQLDFKKNHTIQTKHYMCWMTIILCQWDFSEQIKKLVRLLLYTSENCWRKFHSQGQSVSTWRFNIQQGWSVFIIDLIFEQCLTWWYILKPHWGFLYFYNGFRVKCLNPFWYQSLLNVAVFLWITSNKPKPFGYLH